jgi:hypothetical protein
VLQTGRDRAQTKFFLMPDTTCGVLTIWRDSAHQNKQKLMTFFTLPPQVASLALQNKKVIYGLLLRSSAETLLEVA